MARSLRVGVLAFDGCLASETFGLVDMMTVANEVAKAVQPLAAAAPFRARVMSVEGASVTVAGGAVLRPERATRDVDLIVVPGFPYPDPSSICLSAWEAEIAFLRTFRRKQTHIASLCIGAFLLAEAGLLDGHTVTTSWLFAPELARRYPKVDVQSSAVVVKDGRVSTSAAFSAWQDLALQVIAAQAGSYVAEATSKLTLVAQTRHSQAPFVDDDMRPVRHAGFSDDIQRWLRLHLAERYDLSRVAREFSVSTRTLLRRFAAETGQSPLDFLQAARVSAAKRLLETSDLSIGTITAEVGYVDAATFRGLFVASTGITPSEYRRQFGRPSLTREPAALSTRS